MVLVSDLADKLNQKLAIASVELAGENAAFYLTAWLFGMLLPEKHRIIKYGKEALQKVAVVETIDSSLRLLCFFLSCYSPDADTKKWLTGSSSLALDFVFILLMVRSHRLVEIVSLSSRNIKARYKARFGHPKFIGLGLARPVAA